MLSRRALIGAAALVPAAALGGAPEASAGPGWGAPVPAWTPPQPPIRPRPDWGSDSPVRGPLQDEPDVRFLLVHHTLTPNGDAPERIPERLRSVYRFHTGPERGWPDVAYNFFVDPHGVIWEGRADSLTRPVMGDASGGSQGHALLCCFLGDFTAEVPTEAAMTSMVALLGWLAGRAGLDLAAPVTFTSRGSSRWRRGTEVTTDQVAAHRDMSATECPGDALYPLVRSRLLPQARALLVPLVPDPPAPGEAAGSAAAPEASGAPAGDAPIGGGSSTGSATGTESAGGGFSRWQPDLTLVRGVSAGVTLAALAGVAAAARAPRPSAAEELEQQEHPADHEGGEEADQEPPNGR